MAIMMDEFLTVGNIAPSSYILLRNNLSYIWIILINNICFSFHFRFKAKSKVYLS